MFETLTKDNITMYAIQHYHNPSCEGMSEFNDDMKRFKYVKRLFRKYKESGILKERLLLNHIIILSNVFGADAASTLLLFKVDKEYWPALKPFMIKLNMVYETDLKDIPMDTNVWSQLDKI